MHPDILGQIDPPGRGQQGSAWKGRSKGCNRDFLALGRWRRRWTAGTSGFAVGFGGHFCWRFGGLCCWPPNTFGRKMETKVNESTLKLTVILHGTTQTRFMILPKVTNNALITINNVSCHCFRSFTIVWHHKVAQNPQPNYRAPIQRENKDLDFSIRLHVVIVC